MKRQITDSFLDQLLPFYVQVDENGMITRFGRSIQKICPKLSLESNFFDHFVLDGLTDSSEKLDFSNKENQLIVVTIKGQETQLKGQVVAIDTFMETQYVMAITPFFTNMSSTSSTGLHFGDFAPYDPVFDFLLILQSEKRANKASEEAQERLKLEKRIATLLYQISNMDETFETWQGEMNVILKDVCLELKLDAARILIRSTAKDDVLDTSGLCFVGSASVSDEFEGKLSKKEVSIHEGLSASVHESGKTVWIEDLSAHPRFQSLVSKYGQTFKSGIALPVLSNGRIFAVAEFYLSTVKHKDPTLLLFFDTLSRHLSSIIELDKAHKKSHEHEREISERNEQLLRLNESLESEIQDRKRVQESLVVEKEKAEKANRAKSEFLANMSHEIRTPLIGIIGMTYLLEETKMTDVQQGFLEKVKISGQHLLSLINDVLDFSKVEAGELSLEHTPFSVFNIAHDLQLMFRELSLSKGLKLSILCDPGIPANFLGDPVRFKQIFVNLLGNAIKFTKSGSVNLSLVAEELGPNKTKLKCSVSDTGPGIPKSAHDRMFKLFSQADSSTTRQYGGTGLGLAITKKLVDAMSGRIYFESELDVGSTFFVEIDFEIPQAVAFTSQTHSADVRSLITENQNIHEELFIGKFILVAEDNEINQVVIKTILEDWKFKVQVASNGEEAVEFARKNVYDLILMDCQMPVMSGFDATKSIRALNNPSCKTPIIAMTANAIRGDQERCLASGMNDYTTKPLRIEEVKRILGSHLIKEKTLQPSTSDDSISKKTETLDQEDQTRLIDENALAMLKKLKSPEGTSLFDTQVPKFIAQSPAALSTFWSLHRSGQSQELGAEVHKFKSSCGIVGALRLFEVCDALEQSIAEEPSSRPSDADLVKLESCLVETNEALKKKCA